INTASPVPVRGISRAPNSTNGAGYYRRNCTAIMRARRAEVRRLPLDASLQQDLEVRPRFLRLGPRHVGRVAKAEIAMDQALALVIPGRNARLRQNSGIGRAFIAQRIEPRRGDDRGRKPLMAVGAQRRDAPVGAVLCVGKIMAAKPLHHRARQEIALGIFATRGEARVLFCVGVAPEGVGDGIDQQLTGEPDGGIAAGDRGASREIAAGAVAGQADAKTIAAEFGDVFDDVAHGGKSILERAGKARFGRTPVIDRDHHGTGLDREPARLPVMGVESAGAPAAAMEEHHGRRFFSGNAIDPRRQRARRALYAYVSHGAYRRGRHRRAGCCQRTKRIAGALRGHDRRIAQRQQRNDGSNHGVERCGHAKTPKSRGCGRRIRIVSTSAAGTRAGGVSHNAVALRDQHSRVESSAYPVRNRARRWRTILQHVIFVPITWLRRMNGNDSSAAYDRAKQKEPRNMTSPGTAALLSAAEIWATPSALPDTPARITSEKITSERTTTEKRTTEKTVTEKLTIEIAPPVSEVPTEAKRLSPSERLAAAGAAALRHGPASTRLWPPRKPAPAVQ